MRRSLAQDFVTGSKLVVPFRRRHPKHDVKTGIMNFTKNLGMLVLAIYLILAGLGMLIHTLAIPLVVMGILALAAGILILIGK